MFGNMHNQGALRGRIFKGAKTKKSAGIEGFDSIDKYDQPIRMHRGVHHRPTAKHRGDGFDDLRISRAEDKRESRRQRNVRNCYQMTHGRNW